MSEKLRIAIVVLVTAVFLIAILIPIILVLTEKWRVYPKYSYEFSDNGDIENMRTNLVKSNLNFDEEKLQEIESKA